MTSPRRYTKRQKATAVIAAEMVNVAASAEANGIPESTLRRWMDDPELADLRTKTREDLAQEAHVLAQLAAAEIKRKLPDYEPRDLNVLYGIMVDKAQLLSGHATDRTEVRDITESMTPEAADALANDIDVWLRARMADAGT